MKKAIPFLAIALVLAVAGCASTQVSSKTVPQTVSLSNNEVFNLEAAPLKHKIGGIDLDMLAYNGQIPGPIIRASQGSTIYVNFTNRLNEETTIHWHGIRLNNSNDGTPDVQPPVKPGESFLYKIALPDYGVYLYHPHIREDKQQELGLYGNIIVESSAFRPAGSELILILDDIKITNDKPDAFYDFARFTLMGRFGNHLLVNGQTDFEADVKKGLVRIYLTNAANARPFNFSIEGHQLRVVGGDSGRYEREFTANSIAISPGERYVLEVLFDRTGSFEIRNYNPKSKAEIGMINVIGEENNSQSAFEPAASEFGSIREFSASPDFEFELTMETSGMGHEGHGSGMRSSTEPIEWEDDMGMMNAISTSKNTRWIIRDKSGKENDEIINKVKVGDVRKIRIFNNPDSMHPMQHPMHLHGQRFVVLAVDGKTNDNLVWKDTVLVPTGSTTDILVNFTNPGKWMFHCHIAEHLEAGMSANFEVTG